MIDRFAINLEERFFIMKAYVIYENAAWLPPLLNALENADIPYEPWFIHEGNFASWIGRV